jgi:hypothetical protein
MVFKTVYKIPKSVLKEDSRANYYLEKEDLENLQEYNLLYFLKESQYTVLYDFPVAGAVRKKLRRSKVTGPFEFLPEPVNPNEYAPFESKVIKLLFPKNSIPVNFENVSLVEYGIDTNPDSVWYVKAVVGERINPKQIIEIGEEVLNNLGKRCELQQISESSYVASTNNYLLEFYFSKKYFMLPSLKLILFERKGGAFRELLQETGMYRLEEQFPEFVRDIIIENSLRRGIGFNLTLNSKMISKIIDSENILI